MHPYRSSSFKLQIRYPNSNFSMVGNKEFTSRASPVHSCFTSTSVEAAQPCLQRETSSNEQSMSITMELETWKGTEQRREDSIYNLKNIILRNQTCSPIDQITLPNHFFLLSLSFSSFSLSASSSCFSTSIARSPRPVLLLLFERKEGGGTLGSGSGIGTE